MAVIEITDIPIYTYAPMQEGRKYLAKIGNLPMTFRGKTAMAAHMAADNWRRAQKKTDPLTRARLAPDARAAVKKEPQNADG